MRIVLRTVLNPVFFLISLYHGLAIATNTNAAAEYRSVVYFVNWAASRNHQPHDLPFDRLTHVLYAFANISPESGRVYLSDPYADIQRRYATDLGAESGNNAYGNIKQLLQLKNKNRRLKVLLSIGGWGAALNFTGAASTEINRQNFAYTSVQLVQDLGLDGLDIDWEYPESPTEAQNFVSLLAEVRNLLDGYSKMHASGKRFLLTVASSAAPSNYEKLDMTAMDQYIDFWNLMAYDYSGSWDSTSGHAANVHMAPASATSTKCSTDQAVQYYIDQGISSDKIVLGMPLYGRSFMNTDGPGSTFDGVGKGTWEEGVWDYKDLPPDGSTQYNLEDLVASYSYDEATRMMVSYDTPVVGSWKAKYISTNRLGGAMWWESSGDKDNSESLITTVVNGLGGQRCLDQTENQRSYPVSQYNNIRNWSI
ncbi:endochitinase B1 [Aspergillus floccosus]